jgi:hypothetical protein
MGGWVRRQFEDNYLAARLDLPPPLGKLEEYSSYVLAETSRHDSEDNVEVQAAREAMATAAAALLEYAGRGPRRRPRYASAASKPSINSIRNRTAEVRARYRRKS